MCDAAAVMPDTVTVAVTDRSDLISTVALPVAEVVTGGTSAAPLNSIFWPPIIGAIVAQLTSIPAATSNTIENPANFPAVLIMFSPLKYCYPDAATLRVPHGLHDNTERRRRTKAKPKLRPARSIQHAAVPREIARFAPLRAMSC